MTKRELTERTTNERQTLYPDFISEAARLYAEALTQSSYKLDDLVGLYSLISRMRLIAPDRVIAAAENVVRRIIARYGERNVSLDMLRTEALTSYADPLHHFSMECREDLRNLLRWKSSTPH